MTGTLVTIADVILFMRQLKNGLEAFGFVAAALGSGAYTRDKFHKFYVGLKGVYSNK